MKCRIGMKIAFLFAINLCIACSDKEPSAEELLNEVQKNVVLTRDSLGAEIWLEVEKNETVKICIDSKVRTWETSLDTEILNDSCLKVQIPTLVGVNTINVQFYDTDSAYKINLAVGMKYLDFKNEKVLLGYNNADPKRFASITGAYLVDKYPVTNCEIVQLMWDSIPTTTAFITPEQREWVNRKKASKRDEICDVHDSAAKMIFQFQAMMYANNRSIKEGLKPYYLFSDLPTNYDTFEKKNNDYHRKNKKEKNPFSFLEGNASCLKGGDNKVRLYKKEDAVFSVNPIWTDIGFSYSKINSNAHELAGFRLIRNIGNSAKWTEVKSN